MFPIRDHNPSGQTPYVTFALIAANVLVFLTYLPLMSQPQDLTLFYAKYALIPAEWSFATLVTSMFLHGGFMHIAGNMLFLWIFGDNLEDEMGHLGFFAFYMLSGIAAGFAHVLLSMDSTVPTVGASGAIAGVMGGYLLLFPRARVDVLLILIILIRIFTVPAWVMLILWFGMQLVGAVGSDPTTGGVAYWAHAGGFLIGAILTVPVWLKRGGRVYWNRTHGAPPHPEALYRRSKIPTVQRNQSDVPTVRRRR